MLKRFYPIIIIVIFFILTIPMITPIISQTSTADIEHWTDWVINEDTTITGETIAVHGDVIVKNGSALTLNNCVLKIDSKVAGHNGIEVEAGGELYVYNSTITAYQSYQYYKFDVSGKLRMEGTDVSNMGSLMTWGLYLENTDDAVIKNCRIHDSAPYCNGITTRDSAVLVEDTAVYNTYIGIHCWGISNATLMNNNVWSNNIGMDITENATAIVDGNDVSNNLNRGIGADQDSKVCIINNTIKSNGRMGVWCFGDSTVDLTNNIISNQDRGIQYSDRSHGKVVNNIIGSNSVNGIECGDNATSEIFDNNIISSNGYGGIVCFQNALVNISDNTISYNEKRGIETNGNAITDISDNTISLNKDIGIVCSESSDTSITGNTVTGNDRYGIFSQLLLGGKLIVENNCLYANGEAGIAINFPSDVTLRGNTVSSSLKNGIEVLNGATPLIANSTILDSGLYDIYASNNSHPTMVNTKLDLNKLFFNDTESIVSIGYWVEVNVCNNNSVPVQNAKVIIANNDSIEIFNGSTNYEGHICSMPVIALEMSYTSKKNYTPHSIYVAKLGLSESEQIIVDRNMVVDFILGVSDKLARGNLTTANVDGHEITVEYSGSGSITITSVTNPPPVPKDKKDIGIFFNITATGIVEEIYITVHYDPGDYVPSAQGAVLKMYYWDSGTQQWIPVSESGVDVHNQLVWARVSHLTIFAPMAEEIAKPVSKGNVWLLYGIASITSFAILFVAYIILKRKNILLQSKTGK